LTNEKHTPDHKWIRVEGDTGVVGITDFAQQELGDLVYIELPAVGKRFSRGDDVAVIESVKAAADIKTPLSGTITEINSSIVDDPSKVNSDPTGEGWFFKIEIEDLDELNDLIDEAAYAMLTK
jgi:glycine cleavage system H protein